ncbi:MAG: PQQ-binding-like beta-propeller repeat protein [Phycisphaerae bacterium]|nr:PQQ-binding-like beta-propeller repeat protein [Phycisphaerae bacterium]
MKRRLIWIIAVLLLAQASVRAEWPQFRGPRGDGHVVSIAEKQAPLPLVWSETENVRWKIAIPHRGWSTPVVLDGQVWLTTATPDGRDYFVICVDAESGEVLLNKRLFHCDEPEPLGNNVNGYASPSPTIEAGRVYVHFGSYGTACLDTRTFEVLWERTDLPCRHYRGPGSSVILFENMLIVTMDGVDVQYLVALDKKTGKTVWKTDRTTEWNDLDDDGKPFDNGDLRKAYSTPLIIEVGGETQMISIGARSTYGYDPRDGREIWKVRYPGFSNAACAVYGNGIAYILTGFGRTELYAVAADGRGDVTDTHIRWTAKQTLPQTPSPLLVGDLLFTVSDVGMLMCFDAATGEVIWKERLKGKQTASPVYADGRVYIFDQDGNATVFRPGRTYEHLATSKLDDGCMASPAVSGKAIFVRTKSRLYRIESP